MPFDNYSALRGALSILLALGAAGCGPSKVALNLKIPMRVATNGASVSPTSGSNVMELDVDGSSCNSNNLYPNKPCVTVTVCPPGGSACAVINDVLLDTGSVGLRVFKSVLDANQTISTLLTQVTTGGIPLAECAQFADGSADWGPVKVASVTMGGESTVQVPIQVIDSTYGQVPSGCPSPETAPTGTGGAGYNGILGVGLTAQDCGSGCVTYPSNGMYFACNGTSCNGTSAALSLQLENPVYALPLDNNGVILELPSIALGGVSVVNGYLVFGIGTRSNNIPASVSAFMADSTTLDFTATASGTSYTSFIDSGTNSLSVPPPSSAPDCGGQLAGFLCPSQTLSLNSTVVSSSGSPSAVVPYQIGNANTLFSSPNAVFIELGTNGGSTVDLGLPFFLGRNVYVGIEGRSSSLGSGPFWGF